MRAVALLLWLAVVPAYAALDPAVVQRLAAEDSDDRLAAIALLVGGVGVMNIMLVNVTQRTREIGVRKALGATRRDIAEQFLIEAVTLTGVGGLLGIGVGFGVAFLVRALLDFQAAAPAWSVVLGLGVSTVVGLVFGMWPALRAARQDPIDALRYE